MLLSGKPESVFHNPSLADDCVEFSFLAEKPFSMKELSLFQAAASMYRWACGVFTLKAPAYSELTFAVGRSFRRRRLRFGFSFYANTVSFGDCARLTGCALSIGGSAELKRFTTGFHIRGIKLHGDEDVFPRSLSLSTKFNAGKNFDVYLDAFQEEGFPVSFRITALSRLSRIEFSFGVSTEPAQFAVGFTVKKLFEISYLSRVHPVLGVTHCLGVSIGVD